MSDGYAVRGRIWRPANASPERAIIYIHGIQSHGGWFEWSASLLASCGLTVILPDRRGSGLNQVARGDTPSLRRWLLDLDDVASWASQQLGATRFGLVGVSWGGKLATRWALENPTRIDHLLLIAPGFFPAVDIGLWERLRVGWALLTSPDRRFRIPLDVPALFTQNPEGQVFIDHDPMKLTAATARFLYCSAGLDRLLRGTRRGRLRTRTTLLLSSADRIILNPPTNRWIIRITAAPPTVRTIPNSSHTLEFEANRTDFEVCLLDWARCVPAAPRRV